VAAAIRLNGRSDLVGKLPTMAYLVDKGDDRYEVRESIHHPTGPRSRTLVSFKVLDDRVLEQARSRAAGSVDVGTLCRSARRLGIPVVESRADASARVLLYELAAGRPPSPGLVGLLRPALPEGPDGLAGDLFHWAGASDRERGAALLDLLDLVEKLPTRRRGPLRFPKFGTQ
jgi:hypothetical protein